jgi:hypothetical protein
MHFKDVINQIEGLFENVCVDLFESLNCSARHIQLSDYELESNLIDAPIACIDAGSDEVELMIGLQLPMSVLALTYPVQADITGVDEERLEDWTSELSNQLIGRLKSKLLAHKCQVSLGLPTTYFGTDIGELITGVNEIKSIIFDLDGEYCACHILIDTFSDELSFSDGVDNSIDIMAEGDIELF